MNVTRNEGIASLSEVRAFLGGERRVDHPDYPRVAARARALAGRMEQLLGRCPELEGSIAFSPEMALLVGEARPAEAA